MIAPAELLTKVKLALRISHTQLDGDIEDTIAACLSDLTVCGVTVPDSEDALILNAVKLYCRAAYTDDPNKATLFHDGYNSLKSCLMMASGYREEVAADE